MHEFIELVFRTDRIRFFVNSKDLKINPEMNLIAKVERGEDIGKVMNCAVSDDELERQYQDGKIEKILRIATHEDEKQFLAVQRKEIEAKKKFVELEAKYAFSMKLLDAIYQLDGNKLTFFFSAEGRIDFREFVRELASEFKTRIELHQTSGREDARRLGGLGICGKPYCCVSFLKKFNQVTIQMAKDQNLLSNLSKVSGPCGRLLCCLHYEENFYQERLDDFPELGKRINYDGKEMFVDKNDYYNNRINLVSEDRERVIISLKEFNQISKK